MTVRVGELRPSQLLHTFGVGAVVDLPGFAAMVLGLDDWERARCQPLAEERLLAAVRQRLGAQVETLVAPPRPTGAGDLLPALDEDPHVGVPVAPFPRWMRCQRCDALLHLRSSLVQLKADPYRPEKTRFVHVNCSRPAMSRRGPLPSTMIPARFVVACERGHLDDFSWLEFVHRDRPVCADAHLTLREMGVSGEAADVEIRCTSCDTARRMADAFGTDADLPACRGRRPHLRDFDPEKCAAPLRTLLLGASNSWFGLTLSALAIPEAADPLDQLVEDAWGTLKDVDAVGVLGFLRRQGLLGDLARHGDAEIWAAIQRRRVGGPAQAQGMDLKAPEWQVLSDPAHAPFGVDFRVRAVPPPSRYAAVIERVILAERLREVSALVGFTRVQSPYDLGGPEGPPEGARAPLARTPPAFVPASEVRGEGIFVQLSEVAVANWISTQAERERDLREAHRRWYQQRGVDEAPPFEGMRLVLVHSLAHALMRQLSLECGYAPASLRERLYAREAGEPGGPMAGFLLYTAAPDSEGTLGGLVALGAPEPLERHLDAALEDMRLCASDPLCAEHHPVRDGTSLHIAACHACMFAPETSCEKGNRYLDRGVLVDTVAGSVGAFFR
ncbi:DUF1998 domain-containing protein [Anaeromyxobacter oryzisoli]|uniref:DUF1998 domain-containing protein n=1 Tax=Anaeromyxobacter oryzisoli TaxID=2925408 RepID=UPI001F590CE9|nr:DUF1998 domain-containing protein [Anaeromyxobacter sp. SG63]